MLKRLREILTRRGAKPSSDPAPPQRDKEDRITVEPPPIHHGPKVVHRPIPLSDIDPDAVKILRRLTRFNHTAYLVGGCVRDLLLDRHPKDFDIGTTATPRQVKRVFSNCRIIGKRFRLAHVYFQNGKIIEVATFRARDGNDAASDDNDGDSDILIRDDNIFGTPEEDALRRDFTINALFYDANEETVLDHADGLGDLRRRLVRTIGDAEIRFREDPIRILRAIKFAARLDFEIETETRDALKRTRNLIPKAAPSRVLEEINRFCRGGAARRSFELLRDTGVFEVILPDFAEGYSEDPRAWRYLMELLDALDRRRAADHGISTGEILTVLLLPLISRRMGWNEDGVAQRRRGTNVRELADELVRPMAVRLRVARKDQEHCRQILMTLFRMVPARDMRRGARQALAQRPCMSDCLWILEAVAKRLGGDFESSFRDWSSTAPKEPKPSRTADGRRPAPKREPRGDEPEGERKRRRRSPRKPRRRSGQQRPAATADEKPVAAKPSKAPKDDLPPPWDDSYFFAALPSVPEDSAKDDGTDRYGADSVAKPETSTGTKPEASSGAQPEASSSPKSEASSGDAKTDSAPAPRPRPRRRRRGRRKPRSSDGNDPKKPPAPSSDSEG
jgi:poly(A) polymerase